MTVAPDLVNDDGSGNDLVKLEPVCGVDGNYRKT